MNRILSVTDVVFQTFKNCVSSIHLVPIREVRLSIQPQFHLEGTTMQGTKKGKEFLSKNKCGAMSVGVHLDNLFLSTELKM